jgi:hypothetical protein
MERDDFGVNSPVSFDNTPSSLGPVRGAIIASDDVNNNQPWVFSVVSGFDINYTPFTPIPEPSTVVLGAFGLASLAVWKLRRSR